MTAPYGTCDLCPNCAGCRVGHVHCRPCRCSEAVAAERARIKAAVEAEHQAIRDHFGAEPDEYVGLPLAAVLAIVDPD